MNISNQNIIEGLLLAFAIWWVVIIITYGREYYQKYKNKKKTNPIALSPEVKEQINNASIMPDSEINNHLKKASNEISNIVACFLHETGRAYISRIEVDYDGINPYVKLISNVEHKNFVLPLSIRCDGKYKN